VCKMPGPACRCRIHWTSPDAHCWNVVKRRKAWRKPRPRYIKGVLAKYASAVTSASLGAVTDHNLEV